MSSLIPVPGLEIRISRPSLRRFIMSNDAPINGYVDPSIPNPNKEIDAPIIIYGYVYHYNL